MRESGVRRATNDVYKIYHTRPIDCDDIMPSPCHAMGRTMTIIFCYMRIPGSKVSDLYDAITWEPVSTWLEPNLRHSDGDSDIFMIGSAVILQINQSTMVYKYSEVTYTCKHERLMYHAAFK